MEVFSRDANIGFFLDRFCGFWKLSQFPRMQKILWNNIRSFERHASMFWKYFDWSQLFFCEKSTHILGLQQAGKVNILFCTICWMSNRNVSRCFLFLKSWKPRSTVEFPICFWGVFCIPQPSAVIPSICHVRIVNAHFIGEGLKASYSPVFQLNIE